MARRPPPPRRPAAVELAAALLIVGGTINLFATLAGGAAVGGVAAPGPILVASIALDVLLVVVGLGVRAGRWWIGAINVSAVVVFLYGTSALDSGLSEIPVVFALLYGTVFVAIFLNRAWFEAMRAWQLTRR